MELTQGSMTSNYMSPVAAATTQQWRRRTVILLLLLAGASLQQVVVVAVAQAQQETTIITIDPRCPSKCGSTSIPYPFGTGTGCFLPGFEVTCNNTFHPPRLFVEAYQFFIGGNYFVNNAGNDTDWSISVPMEVMDISVSPAQVRVYATVSYDCMTNNTYQYSFLRGRTMVSDEVPYLISSTQNVLIGVGMNVVVELSTSMYSSVGSSLDTAIQSSVARCNSHPTGYATIPKDGPCSGQGCCEAEIPKELKLQYVTAIADTKRRTGWAIMSDGICYFAMLVEKGWYNFTSEDVNAGDGTYFSKKFPRGIPQVLDFTIGNGSCPSPGQLPAPQGYACLSGNSSCFNAANNRTGYVCKCWEHYDGNPYIPGTGGCQDRYPDLRAQYPCSSGGICKNRLGGYDCPCKPGMKGDGKTGTCTEKFPLPAKVAVGVVGGISIIAVLVLFVLFQSEKKRMREFYRKNGGPILEKISNIQIFREEELKRSTENYTNILGQGAFGVVYKGFIKDSKQHIAVKKSKSTNKAQIDQFTNELTIQSRVIHKNIVGLVGCCLEVSVPILVYEFVPNGSLEDILHGKSKVPLTIDQRLIIAAESAEGLAYMHSKTSKNIQHGDVKPANILLDDNYIPKISDFGISRLIARSNDQLTEEVIGDNNYMDPVYRETGLLTNKSDVYSFGLVLFEIITGNKADGRDNCSSVINHLETFTKKNTSNVRSDIPLKQDELLQSLAEIARECLYPSVDQRPEMTNVAERLQNIRKQCYARMSSEYEEVLCPQVPIP